MSEAAIVQVWIEILGVEKVDKNDDFYALGGHSLLATQVLSRLNKVFDISIPLVNFFESTKIKVLSELVNTLLWAKRRDPIVQNDDIDNEEREVFII